MQMHATRQARVIRPSGGSGAIKPRKNKALMATPVVQESPFFAILNLDVRMMICDQLCGLLPPLVCKDSTTYDAQSVVLCCRQANMVSELFHEGQIHINLAGNI